MGALDRRIIAELGRDGRAQSTAIGEALGVGGNLVAARIRTMEATGAVRVLAVADFRVHGYRMLALIRLRVRGRAPGAVAAELSRRADLLAVHLTSGRFQVSCLHAFVGARGMSKAARDVSRDIAGVDDVDVELLNNVYKFIPSAEGIEAPAAVRPSLLPATDTLDREIVTMLATTRASAFGVLRPSWESLKGPYGRVYGGFKAAAC